MGGWWVQPGGDGAYSFLLSDGAGEIFALENLYRYGCSILYYANLTDVANTLAGSGWAAQSGTGDLTLTGGTCPITAAVPETFSGTVVPTVSIDLATAGLNVDDFVGEYQAAYATPANVPALAGAYTMLSGDTFNIDQNGGVSLSEAVTGCAYAGTVSVIDPAYSIYRLQLIASGCANAAWDGIAQTGLVSFIGNNVDGSDVVFGGTHFVDSTGQQQLKLFQ